MRLRRGALSFIGLPSFGSIGVLRLKPRCNGWLWYGSLHRGRAGSAWYCCVVELARLPGGSQEDNISETLTFYCPPRDRHKHLKSTNMLEG